jgi:hypothetical protein
MKTIIGATLLALAVGLTPQTQLTPEIEQPLERISTKATVIEQGDFKPVALASAKVVRSEPEKPTQGTRMAVSGNHSDWLRSAGIPKSVWSCAEALVQRESGWSVTATNPSSSAYGLPQSLPGNKMASAGADWRTNPVTQLRWMDGYTKARYGGWCQANSFQLQNSWY